MTPPSAGSPPGDRDNGANDAPAGRCPRCGRPLRQTTLDGLCPACLMRQALAPQALPHDPREDEQPGEREAAERGAAAHTGGVAFTLGHGGGATIVSSSSLSSSSLSSSAWTLVTLIADDEECVTYLAREQPSTPAGARGAAADAGAGGGAGPSARLAQLLVRKQHVPVSELAQARQQLQRRRDALRRLHHPALAPVLDGGITEDGHPFLVTAFVMAAPLADADAEPGAGAGAAAAAGARADAGAGAGADAGAAADAEAEASSATRRLLDQAREGLQALHDAGLAHGRVRASTILAQRQSRRTPGGATAVVTGFAPLAPFPTLSDGIADDLAQFQRLTSTLRV